jgi:hypothetical protein
LLGLIRRHRGETPVKDINTDGVPSEIETAAWRSQAFWGLLVWVDEHMISTNLKLRHYYTLAALVDREEEARAGVMPKQMTTMRLTDSLRRQFAGEYDQETDPERGQRQAENDLVLLRGTDDQAKALIYYDAEGLGWRPTPRATAMMRDISDDLGKLAFAQVDLLQKIIPERNEQVTENKDGFYNRAKGFLARVGKVLAVIAVAVTVAGAAVGSHHQPYAEGYAVAAAVPAQVQIATGPRDFADETLT